MILLNRRLKADDRVRFLNPAYGFAEGMARRVVGDMVTVRLFDGQDTTEPTGPDAVVPIAAVEKIDKP